MLRLIHLIAFCVVAAFAAPVVISLSALPAIAQTEDTTPNYVDWVRIAERAEGVLEDRRASNVALSELRATIADWRTKFLNAQASNESRIDTVRNQIAALGPLPSEGVEEAPEIASRRSELNTQLARLDAPRLKADEAYSRADGIIREIDAIVRERQAESLTEMGPSPLNPTYWLPANTAVFQTLGGVGGEVSSAWQSATQQTELRESLPATLFFLVISLVLLGRGRHWMEQLTLRVLGPGRSAKRKVQGFIISLGQVIVPVVGIAALVEALFSTKLFGFRGQIIIQALPLIGVIFFGARWLANRLFPLLDDRRAIFDLAPAKRKKIRFWFGMLGLLYGLNYLIDQISSFDDYSDETRAVLSFPILALTGYLLLRSGRIILRAHQKAKPADGEGPELRSRIGGLVGRAILIIGIIGPTVAAFGYTTAANYFVYPTVLSLGLLGLILSLQHLIANLYAWMTSSEEDGDENALIPVLAGFGVMMASLPLFALIWGARSSDLTEIWTRFTEGFSLGETRISPTDFLTFALVFVIGYMLTRLLQGGLKSSVLPKTKMDQGGQNAIVSGVGYVGVFLAAIIGISAAGIDLSSLAIVAGALSVGIGFGLQNIVSNFVSGIILLIERPIAEGDWIEVGGQMGYVRDISVRSTRIETFDRTDVIVPNADLVSGTVTNYTRGNLIGRVIVPVGVAYGSDTKHVENILKEIAEAQPLVTLNPPPSIVFQGFGADSMDFEIRAILRDVNFTLSVRSSMNHEIARRFAEEGIEIPFAQRDVWIKNPEALQPKPPARKSKGTS